MGLFDEIYARSLRDPDGFWAEAAEAIEWDQRWERVLDDRDAPHYRWFPGARLNTCHTALDLHVAEGRGEQLALIYDSPVTGSLQRRGVGVGDRVVIYMPMIPETVMAMLACARLGAIHSVVFGGFASQELATRIDDCTPKLVLSASCGIEVDRIIPRSEERRV